MEYKDFLKNKAVTAPPVGYAPDSLNSNLFDFQSDIASWACRRGIGIELKPSYFSQAAKNLDSLKNKQSGFI